MEKEKFKLIQKNKKAYFNYEIIEELECGMALVGTEVKSVRMGRVSFGDSYIVIKDGTLNLIGFTIQPYSHGSVFNHQGDRKRVLLAHKQEIKKFNRKHEKKKLYQETSNYSKQATKRKFERHQKKRDLLHTEKHR